MIEDVTNSKKDWYDFWYNSDWKPDDTGVELEDVTDDWYDDNGQLKH